MTPHSAAQRLRDDIEAKVAQLPQHPKLYRQGRVTSSKRGATGGTSNLRRFFTPHFKHVRVWEKIYPTRHNLYFAASQNPIEAFG